MLPSTQIALLAIREDARLVPAVQLVINDAPWLAANLINRDTVQFVHAYIEPELARLCGMFPNMGGCFEEDDVVL